jgi:hypothetical protein
VGFHKGTPLLSNVAGILDSKGGLRVVVTQRAQMRHHLGKGEKLFVVPGFLIKEPVPWHYIPVMIRRVELYILWWIRTRNDPNEINTRAIRRYMKNPNASHNLRPEEFAKVSEFHQLRHMMTR